MGGKRWLGREVLGRKVFPLREKERDGEKDCEGESIERGRVSS